jgi:hypothetical protein
MTNTESRETHLVLTALRNRNCRRKTMEEIARWMVNNSGVNPSEDTGTASQAA